MLFCKCYCYDFMTQHDETEISIVIRIRLILVYNGFAQIYYAIAFCKCLSIYLLLRANCFAQSSPHPTFDNRRYPTCKEEMRIVWKHSTWMPGITLNSLATSKPKCIYWNESSRALPSSWPATAVIAFQLTHWCNAILNILVPYFYYNIAIIMSIHFSYFSLSLW